MIVFYELRGREYEEIGRVADGEIISGRDELKGVVHGPMLSDEEELLNVHDGPHVLAEKVEETTEKWLPYEDDEGRGWIRSDASEVRYSDDPPGEIVSGFEKQAQGWTDTDPLEKNWIPYQGPHGGEGWQNVETGEVRYQEEPPGPVQGMGEGDQSPQRWGSWDGEDDDAVPGSPDNDDETDLPERDEITWENVQVGDEVAYYDKYGEMQEGEVTSVEQDEFGAVWVQPEEGAAKVPVEQDDFVGGTDQLLGETVDVPDELSRDWMDENLFIGQRVKLYNSRTDSIEYAEIEDVFVAGGEINAIDVHIEQEHGFGTTVTLTNDGIDWGDDDSNDVFELREAESWESLEREDQLDAIESHIAQNVRFTNMGNETRRKVSNQIFDEVLPSFKDTSVARRTGIGLFKMEDYVSRASCSGVDGYNIKVSERSPLNTLHHEFGHGIVSAYGFHYQRVDDNEPYSDEKFKRRPTNLSHDYHEIKNHHGTIDFDFSEDSEFFDPEAYMLRLDAGRDSIDPRELRIGETYGAEDRNPTNPFQVTITPTSIEQYEEGGNWFVEVEEYTKPVVFTDDGEMLDRGEAAIENVSPDVEFDAAPVGYDEWKEEVEQEIADVEYPGLDELDYTPMGDREAGDLFEDLEEGDAVKFSVPARDPPTQYLVFEGPSDRFERNDEEYYEFRRPSGHRWAWAVDPETGELDTDNGSFIAGFAERPDINLDEANNVEHPLGHWDGFDPNPETAEDKIDNLVSAVNRAWYKQAKKFETSSDAFENMSYYIGSGYSATNAHETMAQMHQAMQDGDVLAVSNTLETHPSLVAAYLDVFEPSEDAATIIRDHKLSDKYGIEL